MNPKLPSVVIVGRPNVGKSTLFNRLTGTRRSIVTDEPGITRDRIYGTAAWLGRPFEIVDTGGLLPDDRAAIPREILKQAQAAIADATALVLVVDARAGATPLDLELARRLRRTGKPFVVAVNKVDTQRLQDLAAQFYEIGAEIFPLSAEHGLGVDTLLDALTRDFPPSEADGGAPETTEVQVAIIGRPNVGKSTLLNQLAGAERSIVSAEPGTTRDAVDTVVLRSQKGYRFIDTAGIRRKGKTELIAEKLSVIMARKHLERADLALLVADAAIGVTAGDATIAGYAQQSGRSVIVVMNKWDLALEKAQEAAQEAQKQRGKPPQEERTRNAKQFSADPKQLAADYEILVRERLKFLPYAPIIFVSALTGEHVEKLYGLIDRVAEARKRRISTAELNRWLASVDLARGTSPAARRVKIYYMTQSAVSPPTFILFTNQRQRLHFSYERFLENRLREHFDFFGSPIRFIQRFRERARDDRERPAQKRRRAD
ncbi:MAG TPA: ribosome biogenesis GTPase Der [Rugosimonospora sp.]|nr:ribosome biogenesis GTPase Der [Rugosimonospora sp.]